MGVGIIEKMKTFKLTTPVLYLVFNRLDVVKETFLEIQKAKPFQLFVACDGPRNSSGKKKTDAVKKYILDNINWKCEVKTLFRKKNLGCKYAVSGAIDWFFENVEQGIIIEDDCLPNQSFFRFCQEMLEKYKDNDKIASITGQNMVHNTNIRDSFTFSKYSFIWGWATWRDSWKDYNVDIENFEKIKEELRGTLSFIEILRLKKVVKDLLLGKTNTWDVQWSLLNLIRKSLCIVPRGNLIENLGLEGKTYTHTKPNYFDKLFLFHKRVEMRFPLEFPKEIVSDKKFDKKYFLWDIIRASLKCLGNLFSKR